MTLFIHFGDMGKCITVNFIRNQQSYTIIYSSALIIGSVIKKYPSHSAVAPLNFPSLSLMPPRPYDEWTLAEAEGGREREAERHGNWKHQTEEKNPLVFSPLLFWVSFGALFLPLGRLTVTSSTHFQKVLTAVVPLVTQKAKVVEI